MCLISLFCGTLRGIMCVCVQYSLRLFSSSLINGPEREDIRDMTSSRSSERHFKGYALTEIIARKERNKQRGSKTVLLSKQLRKD